MLRFLKIIIAVAVIIFLLYISHGFILEKAGRHLYYKDEMKPADVIVILGGEETERVIYGVKLFKEGWARKDRIILAGGPVVWRHTWASLMKGHAVSLGVPKNAIILEDKSRNAEEGAIFTKKILDKYKYKSCVIVTSPYHSRRAAKTFKKVMGDEINVISAPCNKSWFSFDEWWKRRRDRAMVLNEYSKLIWLWIFGIKGNA
ncbi:MAG: YdcF family protein [Nitrospirota bacterium]